MPRGVVVFSFFIIRDEMWRSAAQNRFTERNTVNSDTLEISDLSDIRLSCIQIPHPFFFFFVF